VDNNRRFIEESFPVKEVSVESAKEKSIRHGHISTLHIWWARRPLASSRATNYAALIQAIDPNKDPDGWNKKRNDIIDLCKWENSLNQSMIQNAREEILKANGGKQPRVLDPFAGGGAIPLEALPLGCETYASDYNPVATLILKSTLEYPQKYGKPKKVKADDWTGAEKTINPLFEDVKNWGDWVLNEAKKEIGKFYPSEPDGSIPVGYIWARTIPCQNPACSAEIPLMRQYWLAKKDKRKISVFPYGVGREVKFKIVGTGHEPMPRDFNPENGTISRAVVTCPVCGSSVDANTTRQLFQEGKARQRMVAVITSEVGTSGKRYRIATDADVRTFQETEKYLKQKREKLMVEWGIDPVPDEPLKRVPVSFGVINVWVYAMNTWGDLFNSRQKLALITFADKVRAAYKKMMEKKYEEDYAKAVVSYLAVLHDRLADKNANVVVYNVVGEKIEHVFGRQAIGMVWDYAEVNSFTDVGWPNMQDWVSRIIVHCSESSSSVAVVSQSSAVSLPYPDNFFDAIFTDPPYYDNVPYSYISDFFYVWLKRTIGHVHPELVTTPLTPKKGEIVAYSSDLGGFEQGKQLFEDMLKHSFQEIYRVLKPNGITTIVYAHRSTKAWETLVNSLLDSSLVITGAWPLNTEMATRLRANESATLASSIYIVARGGLVNKCVNVRQRRAPLPD